MRMYFFFISLIAFLKNSLVGLLIILGFVLQLCSDMFPTLGLAFSFSYGVFP